MLKIFTTSAIQFLLVFSRMMQLFSKFSLSCNDIIAVIIETMELFIMMNVLMCSCEEF